MSRKIKLKARLRKEPLYIQTETIKLDAALKFSGIAMTGGEAKLLIENENVTVNGEICKQRGKKLNEGDFFSVNGQTFEILKEKPV